MMMVRNNWQIVQKYLWLVAGAICLVVSLIFWAISDRRENVTAIEQNEQQLPSSKIQAEKVAVTSHLGALTDEVQPLQLAKRVNAVAMHEPEFRGSKFIQEQKNQWTIELFRVSAESMVAAYLQQRPDRHLFNYVRLNDGHGPESYVLTYGQYAQQEQAAQQMAQMVFHLPATVKPRVVSFAAYSAMVNDLGSDELANNAARLYQVLLRPVAIPKLEVLPNSGLSVPENINNALPTTQTTIVRKNAEGQVVDVTQSKSVVDVPATGTATKPANSGNAQ